MDSLPLFEVLGYSVPKHGTCYYHFRVGGRVRSFTGPEMHSVAFLLDLYPDADHWRDAFPGVTRTRVDALKAAAHFRRLCKAAGEYWPEGFGVTGDVTAVRESA